MKSKIVIIYGSSSSFDKYKDIPNNVLEKINNQNYTIVYDEELINLFGFNNWSSILNSKEDWNKFINYVKKENNKTFIVRLHASSVQNVFNRIILSKLLTKEDIVNYLECIYTKEIKNVREDWESYIFKDLDLNDNLNNLEELISNIKAIKI